MVNFSLADKLTLEVLKIAFMDTRTLIFSLGLFNLTLALVVFVYERFRVTGTPYLRYWQVAKMVTGVGYILGWSRPLLNPEWGPFIYTGNALQWIGIAIELAVYAYFFGVPRWVPVIRAAMLVAVPVFFITVVRADSNHIIIIVGTTIASLLYLGMSALGLSQCRQSPQLLLLMGVLDGILGLWLAFKVVIGLVGVELVSYQNNLMNTGLYILAFVVMCVNGFCFLLLVQQRFERALYKALDEVARNEEAERELLRVAAHEFRTPAAIIRASLDSLAMISHDLPEALTRRHDNIRQAVTRMIELAAAIISRDRLLDQAVKPDLQAVTVCEMLSKIAGRYPEETPLTVAKCPANLQIQADPVLLHIALHNLVDNGLQHASADKPVMIMAMRDGDRGLVLSVADQGPGVPDELKSAIFRRHYTSSGSLSRGVGLSIVAAIAQAHGGRVWVEDDRPVGSIFSIWLPTQASLSNGQR